MFNRFPWMVLRDGEPSAGSGSGGAAFDPAAFTTGLMKQVNDSINGAIKNLKADLAKKPAEGGGEGGAGGSGGDGGAGGDGGNGDGHQKTGGETKLEKELAKIRTQLEGEQTARKAAESKAEEKDRHATIKGELSKLQYAKPNGADKAFKLIADQIKRGEDGQLETPDGTPLAEWIAKTIETDYDELLAPRQVGGAGAGSGSKGKGGSQEFQIEDIKPGMTPEQRAQAFTALGHALANR